MLTHDIAAFDFDLAVFAYFVYKTDDKFALYQFPGPVITLGCSFSACSVQLLHNTVLVSATYLSPLIQSRKKEHFFTKAYGQSLRLEDRSIDISHFYVVSKAPGNLPNNNNYQIGNNKEFGFRIW